MCQEAQHQQLQPAAPHPDACRQACTSVVTLEGWLTAYCLQLALRLESLTEGGHDQLDVLRLGVVAHDAHTEHLAHGGAQAARDLHLVLVHGKLGERGPVHALGHLDRVHSGQPELVLLHKGLQPQGLEARPQLVVHVQVPLPHGVQPLLRHDRHRLAHGVKGGHGAGVVVRPLAEPPPVVAHQVEVQVVGGGRALARQQLLQCALPQHHGRRAGGPRQALLRARVDRVNAPVVREQRHAAQRAHRVHQQQRAVLAAQLAQARQALVRARRRLALAQEQQLGLVRGDGRLERVVRERLAQRRPDLHHVAAEAARHLGDAVAPDARGAHHHLVARLHQVGDAHLHAGVPRA
mmetsp:Transcript_19465/g.49518  ORF Transcript_19465/g.49518 Transcript_19465/m.49518 type:complete len:350 (+) Transcript_19465:536-1585(+)